jgi:signal transduction histidine kinase
MRRHARRQPDARSLRSPFDEAARHRARRAARPRALWLPLVALILIVAILTAGPIVVGSRIRAVRSSVIDIVDPARLHAAGSSAALAEQMLAVVTAPANASAIASPRYRSARREEAHHAAALDSLVPLLGSNVEREMGAYRVAAARWHARLAAGDGRDALDRKDSTRAQGVRALDAAMELAAVLETEYAAGRRRVRYIERADLLLPTILAPLGFVACALVVRAGRRTVQTAVRAELDRSALAEATEQKNALIRGMSHDLQNPLGAVLGYTDLILEGVVAPPDQRGVLERSRLLIIDAADTVRTLLALARSDGGLKVDRRELSLADIARAAAQDSGPAAHAKRQTITCSARSDCTVRGDPGRVRHIIDNLISNAVKYSPAGGQIRVVVGKRDARGRQWCVVTVSDSGPGIPPDAAPHLFEEFFRAPTTRDTTAGHGIGLSASRRFAQMMHGDLTLDEIRHGMGASFTLWLPEPEPSQLAR